MSKRHVNSGSRNRSNYRRGGKRSNSGRRTGGGVNIGAVSAARTKYLEKAKDALMSGDRVTAEHCYQHADHYTRVLEALSPEKNDVVEGQKSTSNEKEVVAEEEKKSVEGDVSVAPHNDDKPADSEEGELPEGNNSAGVEAGPKKFF